MFQCSTAASVVKQAATAISGESFAMAAQVLLDKWEARGLNPTVLAAIRTEVFDTGEPKP